MNNLGIIGLGTMGAALARNFASKSVAISVYNRTASKTEQFIAEFPNSHLYPFFELSAFVQSIESPRKIILMVNAGEAVDKTIELLLPLLDKDDVIIDCGNSNWKDTQRRQIDSQLLDKGIYFVGCGVSGGEEGALNGPSIMPGGNEYIVSQILPLLEKVSAKDFAGQPCVTNVGLGASGHFVKMVHNGIEYALMQGIAEIYDILKANQKNNGEICEIFNYLNQDDLKSFLLDITVDIFQTKDTLDEGYLIDKISSLAGSKGTGKWTVEASLELGVFTPSICAAVMARIGSAKNEAFRNLKLKKIESNPYPEPEVFLNELKLATYGLFLSSYLQGLDLIDRANKDFNWGIDLSEVIRIWQGGCIIRSYLLESLYKKWTEELDFSNQIWALDFICSDIILKPLMVLHGSLDYFLTLSTNTALPTNLIQAQRDYFGAHTYQRIDKEGTFTGGWDNKI